MAVVGFEELLDSRTVSGQAREGFKYGRAWLIRTNVAAENLVTVARAPGIKFGDAHPNDSTAYVQSFDLKPHSSNPMFYVLSVEYGPIAGSSPDDPNNGGDVDFIGMPPDQWSGGVNTAAVAATKLPDTPNGTPVPVENTAGVPFADVQVEQARYTLTLARSYADMSFLALLATNTNTVNKEAWAGCDPRTWLCKGGRWDRALQTEGGSQLKYYRVTWEFEYRPDQWILPLLSTGYQELVGGSLRPIVDDAGEPVSEPRALDQYGAAEPHGNPPHVLTFYPHKEIDFTAAFGAVH